MPFNHQEIIITKTMNVYPPLEARPMKNIICLFDLDGTLCLEKQVRTKPSQVTHTWRSKRSVIDQNNSNFICRNWVVNFNLGCLIGNALSPLPPSPQMCYRLC